jgi:hypothetical protein
MASPKGGHTGSPAVTEEMKARTSKAGVESSDYFWKIIRK